MDIQTIEQGYNQLQAQGQQTTQALQLLGGKLQAAANAGDQQAREWFLDLRELALSFQAEQQQVMALLQSLHAGIATQVQSAQPSYAEAPPAAPAPQPSQGGFLGNLMNSGFAQSVAAGAGFGIGDDLIKEIF
ncbi:hypothetical protein [Brytella acorum]|uniref:Uncharacterized protein n=1 Tax=Brytella acorum TaxID=2959299 RepID=A0AA35Y200_9PROT|nr:hypothetical protein [Brytella acorum]MDF3625216.1 hypothetical protein [Brytella acorum]CAI9119372.1 hypothetical protein LMG32879_000186 [Brytella acorum]